MKNPLISIIVPVYNVEKYLIRCIDSIINQTYKNIEIILVDDGSTDSSPSICDEWRNKDNRIIVIHKINGGLSDARNAGILKSNGKYIFFVDSDDYIDFDLIQILYNHINDFDVVVSGFILEYKDNTNMLNPSEKKYYNSEILEAYISDDIRPEACGKLYRAELVREVLFDVNALYGEDVLFNYYIFKKSHCVKLINVSKYHYIRYNENALTYRELNDNRINVYLLFEQILCDCKDDNVLYNISLARYCRVVFALLSIVVNSKQFSKRYFNTLLNAVLKYKWTILLCNKVKFKYKLCILVSLINKNLLRILLKAMG